MHPDPLGTTLSLDGAVGAQGDEFDGFVVGQPQLDALGPVTEVGDDRRVARSMVGAGGAAPQVHVDV